MRNKSGALCWPSIRPPGLLAWGESNTWHLSPHIPFTTNPTPSPSMGELKRHLHTAQTKTQVLLVLSNNSPWLNKLPQQRKIHKEPCFIQAFENRKYHHIKENSAKHGDLDLSFTNAHSFSSFKS